MSQHKLVKIPAREWCNLQKKYLANWPKHMLGYYTIDNFIKWQKNDPNIKNLNCYCLDGDWSDGTFIFIDRYQLFINTLANSNERLTTLLGLLDWTNGFKVSTFLDRHRSSVVTVVNSKNLKREFDSITSLYYMSRYEAAQIDVVCPEGITLKNLTEEDAILADRVWPNRHPGSTFFLKRLANWNPNIGAFNANGKMLAWCFRLQAGPLGAMQTDANHLKQGFGTLVCKAFSKKLGQMDVDVYACVGPENTPSVATFEKIGFKVVDHCHWLRTFPTKPFDWVDD